MKLNQLKTASALAASVSALYFLAAPTFAAEEAYQVPDDIPVTADAIPEDAALVESIWEAADAYSQAHEDADACQETVSALETAMEEATGVQESYQEIVEEDREQIENTVSDAVDQTDRDLEEKEQTLTDLMEQKSEAQGLLEEKEQALQEARDSLKAAEEDLATLEEKQADLPVYEQAVSDALEQVNQLEAALNTASAELEEANSALEAAQNSLQAAETARDKADQDVEDARADLLEKESLKDAAEQAYKEVTDEQAIEAARNAYEAALADLEAADAAVQTALDSQSQAELTLADCIDKVSQAQSEADSAKEQFDLACQAQQAGQQTLSDAEQALEDFRSANQSLIDAYEAKVEAIRKAEEAKKQAEADLEAAESALKSAQEIYDEVMAQWNLGSAGFFDDLANREDLDAAVVRNARLAYEIIMDDNGSTQDNLKDPWGKETKLWEYTYTGDEHPLSAVTSATSLDNMAVIFDYIDESNTLIQAEDVTARTVSSALIAIAQKQLNYAADGTGNSHPKAYNVAENLSWTNGDPYDGWYYYEKSFYYEKELGTPLEYKDSGCSHWKYESDYDAYVLVDSAGNIYTENGIYHLISSSGHYKNLVQLNYKYDVTGFAYIPSTGQRGSNASFGQTFYFGNTAYGAGSMSVAEYREYFNEYYSALKERKTAAETALQNAEDQVASARASLNQANADLQAANARETISESQYNELLNRKAALEQAISEAEDAMPALDQAVAESSQNYQEALENLRTKTAAEKQAQAALFSALDEVDQKQVIQQEARNLVDEKAGELDFFSEENQQKKKQSLEEAGEAVELAEENVASKEETAARKQTSVNEAQNALMTAETSQASQEAICQQAEENLSAARQDLASAREELAHLTELIQTGEAALQAKIDQFSAESARLETEVADLRSRISDLENRISEAESDLSLARQNDVLAVQAQGVWNSIQNYAMDPDQNTGSLPEGLAVFVRGLPVLQSCSQTIEEYVSACAALSAQNQILADLQEELNAQRMELSRLEADRDDKEAVLKECIREYYAWIQPVCRVEQGGEFRTIQAAIDSIETSGTIVVEQAVSESILIYSGQEITLQLAGTLTGLEGNTIAVEEGAILHLQGGSVGCSNVGFAAVYNAGTVSISSCTIYTDSSAGRGRNYSLKTTVATPGIIEALYNKGTMILEDVTVLGTLTNFRTLDVISGTFTSDVEDSVIHEGSHSLHLPDADGLYEVHVMKLETAVVSAPTVESEGLARTVCYICDSVIEEIVLPALEAPQTPDLSGTDRPEADSSPKQTELSGRNETAAVQAASTAVSTSVHTSFRFSGMMAMTSVAAAALLGIRRRKK